MASLGMREYPASVLLDHLLSACYNEAGGSYILKCNWGSQHLVADVVPREANTGDMPYLSPENH